MEKQFYLTEYKFPKSKSQHKLDIKSSNKFLPTLKTNKSFFPINRALDTQKETMLEFLIKEETQYVNLFKCEEYYQNINNQHKNTISINSSELSKKNKFLQSLESEIQTEVLLHIKYNKSHIIAFYEQEIKKINDLIIKEKFDYEHCQSIQNRLLYEKIGINESISQVVNDNNKNRELFEKYINTKQSAQMSLIHKKNIFNEIKDFIKRSEEQYNDDINLKKTKFKELEYKVFKVRSETIEMEKNSEELKIETTNLITKLKTIKKKNIMLNEEKNKLKRDYKEMMVKLQRILKKFHVKSIEDIIQIFMKETRWQDSNYTLVKKINKEISEINVIFSELNSIYSRIKQDVDRLKYPIENKERNKILLNEKNSIDYPEYESILINIKEIIECNNYLNEQNIEKHKILISFCRMISSYYLKINKLLIKIQQEEYSKRRNYIESYNLNDAYINGLIEKIKSWNVKEIIQIFNIFLKFQKIIYELYFSYISNLTLQLSHNSKFEIIDLLHNENSKIDKLISKSLYNLEIKYKILLKSDHEIFNEIKINEDSQKKDLMANSTNISVIYNKFQKYYNDEFSEIPLNSSMKTRILGHLRNFTNELVNKKVNEYDKINKEFT